jgi:hypothetical protein
VNDSVDSGACAMSEKLRIKVALVVCVIFFDGCSLFPQAPSLAEPPLAYVWPTDRCPSELKEHGFVAPLPGAIASVAFGEASSTLFGIPSLLLSQAAKADQAGYTVSSTNARYYYTDATADEDIGKILNLSPPQCYVVAVYKSAHIKANAASSWCADKNFKDASPDSCGAGGAKLLDSLHLTEPIPTIAAGDASLTTRDLRVPDLYAEIGFDEIGEVTVTSAKSATPPPINGAAASSPATGAGSTPPAKVTPAPQSESFVASIVLPKAEVFYYPHSLLTKDSTRARSLTIGVVLSQIATYPSSEKKDKPQRVITTNAAAAAGLLNVNFTVVLNAERPGEPTSISSLAPYPQQAFLLPGLKDRFKITLPSDITPDSQAKALDRIPVNVAVTVHEIGDPSVFLAALAGATQTAGGDYSKAVVSAVLPPPGTQTLGQMIEKNNSAVTAAVGSYWKDYTSYEKECGNPSMTTQAAENSYLSPMWQQIVQDYSAAGQIAASYGTSVGIGELPSQPHCQVKGK